MRNILLTISYDGTNFRGWQRQDKSSEGKLVRTVQQEIETALLRLHGKPVVLHGSGRTDSGVHAVGQAANFFTDIDSLPLENFPKALNSFLPGDVRILSAALADDSFSARFSATSRVYRYFMVSGTPQAAQMNYVWPLPYVPDIERLNAMVSCFQGETDCASFAASGDGSISTCRYIEHACFFTQEGFPNGMMTVFEIEANAFLWRMVRTLTGTLISLDRIGAAPSLFRDIIEARDRTKAGITAPPQGLFLWQVKFDGIRRHV